MLIPSKHIVRDQRGAVFAEYVVVLTLVTLVGGISVALLGLPLLRYFVMAQALILLPFP